MTDLRVMDAPLPTQGLTAETLGQMIDANRPDTGAFLSLNMEEGFWSSMLGQAWANGRLTRADEDAFGTALAEPMDESAWRASPYFRKGLDYDARTTPARAAMRAQIYDENAFRRHLIGQYDAGAAGTVAGFGAGMAGAMLSPENYIPFAGPALRMARAGRFGAQVARAAERAGALQAGGFGARVAMGAAAGSVDATLGNLLSMPVTVAGRESYGDDVGWAEIIQDLAFGAVGGAVLGGGFGAVGAIHARRAARMAAPEAQARLPDTPEPASQDIPAQDAALHALAAASADMAQGRGLDLATLPDNARAALVAARGRQLATWIETPDPAHTDMRAAALDFVQREATSSRPGVARQNRGFSYGFLDAAEVQRLRDLGLRMPEEPARIVDGVAVRHILNDHGPDAPRQPGEAPVTADLIARYPELIRSPLDVVPTRTDRGQSSVTYLLRDADGRFVVAEELRRGPGVMALGTMYRLPDNWGGATLTQVSGIRRRSIGGMDQASPSSTSETGTALRGGLDVTAPDPSPSIAREVGGFHLFPDDIPADFSRAPEPATPMSRPVDAQAAAHGFDLGDAAALDAQIAHLAAEGRLPPDLLAEYRMAVDADARVQHAPAAWQEAANCILRGIGA